MIRRWLGYLLFDLGVWVRPFDNFYDDTRHWRWQKRR